MTGGKKGRSVTMTSTGRSLIAGIVVAWVAGAALGYPTLVALAGGGTLGVLVAAGFVCWPPRMNVDRHFAPPTVTAGEAAVAIAEVTNLSRLPTPPVTVVDCLGGADVALEVRGLGAGGAALVRYALPTVRRGRLALGPLCVVRSDPFGLFRRLQVHGGADVLWVHPPLHRMAPLPSGVVMDLDGPVTDSATAGSVTFSALRDYVVGDDRRQIHWRSSARLATLMVRQHVDTNEPRATIVVDTQASRWVGEVFEEAVAVAASAAHALSNQGHAVSVLIVGEDPATSRSLGAITVGDRLAAASTTEEVSLSSLLTRLEKAPAGGALVVVTGKLESSAETRLAGQSRRFSPVTVCSMVTDRPSSWGRRSGMQLITGPDAKTVAGLWNRMVRR